MAISNAQKTTINKMNTYSQRCALGTIVQNLQTDTATLQEMHSGSMSVTTVHTNGSVVTIPTGVETSKGFVTDFYRSGSKLYHTAYIVTSSCALLVYGNATYVITASDRINWIAY